jgi:hypothetical protein
MFGMFNWLKNLFAEYKDKNIKPKRKFEVNDKVIVKSNEPEPYFIGQVVEYLSDDDDIPKVRDEKTGQEFWCMGAIRPYSKELTDKLDTMETIEQWNYLTHRHCQIPEKYGIKYKTYECNCESCLEYIEIMKDYD